MKRSITTRSFYSFLSIVAFGGPLPKEGGYQLTQFLVCISFPTMNFVAAYSSKFVFAELTSTGLGNL